MPSILLNVVIPEHGLSGGIIAKWHLNDGDFVSANEALLSVELDKVVLEVVAEKSGRLQIILETGAEVLPGTVVASIDTSASAFNVPDRDAKTRPFNREKPCRTKRQRPQQTAIQDGIRHDDAKPQFNTAPSKPLDYAALIGLPEWPEDAAPDDKPSVSSRSLPDYAAALGLPEWPEDTTPNKP